MRHKQLRLPLSYPATSHPPRVIRVNGEDRSDTWVRRLRDWPLARSKSDYKVNPEIYAGWIQKQNIYFLCPFHNERTPSCVWVGGSRQFFHCFGCDQFGTAAELIAQLNKPIPARVYQSPSTILPEDYDECNDVPF